MAISKKYSHKRYRYVHSVEDFNWIIKYALEATEPIYAAYDIKRPMSWYTHIEDGARYIKVTTHYVQEFEEGDKIRYDNFDKNYYPCTWIFDKTGRNDTVIHPSVVARKSNAIYKPYNIVERRPELWTMKDNVSPFETTGALIGYNPKFDMTENYVYGYDLNSAYAAVLVDKIIDTYNYRELDRIKDGEIGFCINAYGKIETVKNKKIICDFVFPLIDSPFKEFVTHWYNVKKNTPKDSKDHQMAKNILVIMVGLWQHSNPLLRAYVVNECNEKIQNLIDDDSCYWNTDAIYSTKKRDDLDIGDEIGQFKLEYEGLFRQKQCNYQKVKTGKVSYRGVVNQAFKNVKDWNILTDDIPFSELKYKFDMKTNSVILNPNYEGDD